MTSSGLNVHHWGYANSANVWVLRIPQVEGGGAIHATLGALRWVGVGEVLWYDVGSYIDSDRFRCSCLDAEISSVYFKKLQCSF